MNALRDCFLRLLLFGSGLKQICFIRKIRHFGWCEEYNGLDIFQDQSQYKSTTQQL